MATPMTDAELQEMRQEVADSDEDGMYWHCGSCGHSCLEWCEDGLRAMRENEEADITSKRLCVAEIDRLRAEAENWKEEARQMTNNRDYWRSTTERLRDPLADVVGHVKACAWGHDEYDALTEAAKRAEAVLAALAGGPPLPVGQEIEYRGQKTRVTITVDGDFLRLAFDPPLNDHWEGVNHNMHSIKIPPNSKNN